MKAVRFASQGRAAGPPGLIVHPHRSAIRAADFKSDPEAPLYIFI